MSLLLRPTSGPTPLVHVEIDVAGHEVGAGPWHILRGTPDRVAHAAAHDAAGDVAITVAASGTGVDLTLARAPAGAVRVAYDVLAGDDAPDDPLGLLVLDDRFRGGGERLVALPASAQSASMPVWIRIDGEPLRASAAASSIGVGAARRTTMPPVALRYATFLAGSLGVQVIDDPGAGHDEAAWLGYTAFDPRATVAELAQVRTGLHELFKAQPGEPWTYLVVSQTRPIGSFTTTPRWTSTVLQVGPSEPWSAGIRLSMAQQLARRWVGGELHVVGDASKPESAAEGGWFSEGVSRYVAMRLLAHLGLLSPDEVRDTVGGELSVLATSPHRALGNARLAELAPKDAVARATWMARGALYALVEAAAIRARTKGQRGLDTVLADLVRRAEDRKQTALSTSEWLEAVGRDDPDAAKTFDALVVRGEPVALKPDTLGPCFRAGTGEYVAYDPGFDVDATRVSRDGRVVGLRADGPAAKAGLRDGDVVESMQGRDGDAQVPIKLVVTRAGAKVPLTYAPHGPRGRGQTWARIKTMRDEQCGSPP